VVERMYNTYNAFSPYPTNNRFRSNRRFPSLEKDCSSISERDRIACRVAMYASSRNELLYSACLWIWRASVVPIPTAEGDRMFLGMQDFDFTQIQ